jgi:SH3-like domain-containing protein
MGIAALARAALVAVALAPGWSVAQTAAPIVAPIGQGPVTGAPLPRFVSLRSDEGRARRGPGSSHRVDWVFRRRDMPLRVTAEFERWRRVEDAEGVGGWVNVVALSGVRTALVTGDMTPMRDQPRPGASEVALLERGVVARILTCRPEWCRLQVEGLRGWVDRRAIWGVDPHEWQD